MSAPSRDSRASPDHSGLRRLSQAHRAPAMGADDSGGERLTAARSLHMPGLRGTPELKNKLRGRLAAAGAAWNGKQHRGTNKRGQQDRPEHQELSEEGEQEIPGMQRNMAWAGGTHWHQEVMGMLQSQWATDLVFQPSAKQENKRKSKVCLDRRGPELLPHRGELVPNLKDAGPEPEPHPTLLGRMVETLAVSQERRKGASRRNKPLYNHVRSLCAAEPPSPVLSWAPWG